MPAKNDTLKRELKRGWHLYRGETPEGVDPESIAGRVTAIRTRRQLALAGGEPIGFDEKHDCVLHRVLHRAKQLPLHTNGMRFTAVDAGRATRHTREYYSIGGGFLIGQDGRPRRDSADMEVPFPFHSSAAEQETSRGGLAVNVVEC